MIRRGPMFLVVVLALVMAGCGPTAADVPTLIEELGSDDAQIRRTAAESLGRIGPSARDAVPALKTALRDRDFPVRVSAGVALMKLGVLNGEVPVTPLEIPILVAALGDEDRDVRESAREGLKMMGPLAAPALAEALEETNQRVRQSAVSLLYYTGPGSRAAVPGLARIIGNAEEEVYLRRSALVTLAQFGAAGERALPVLIGVLDDEDVDVRRHAATVVGKIGPAAREAVPSLINALGDEDVHVRECAAVALGKIGPATSSAIPALADALAQQEPLARTHAAEAILAIGATRQIVPQLTAALEDREVNVRRAVVQALGGLNDQAAEAVPELIDMVENPQEEEYVRRYATEALGNIGPGASDAVPTLLAAVSEQAGRRNYEYSKSASAALGKIGMPAVPHLAAALEDESFQVRKTAAAALSEMGPDAAKSVPALIAAFDDASLRDEASRALGKIGKAAVPALIETLKSGKNLDVRNEAARALGHVGADARPAIPYLAKMIQLSYSGMRRAAADGLVGIGRASLPALVQLHRHALSKGDSQLRAYTSGAINRIDPKIAAQEGIR